MNRLILFTLFVSTLFAQSPKGPTMLHAKGTFEVKVAPTGHTPDPSINSLSIDKQIHGDLEATTKGEMLASGDPKSGNAGYVAIERVTGSLNGKSGSFALMHFGTMTAKLPEMKVIVVPDSGTGDLTGISGTFDIVIDSAGKHSYILDYALEK